MRQTPLTIKAIPYPEGGFMRGAYNNTTRISTVKGDANKDRAANKTTQKRVRELASARVGYNGNRRLNKCWHTRKFAQKITV